VCWFFLFSQYFFFFLYQSASPLFSRCHGLLFLAHTPCAALFYNVPACINRCVQYASPADRSIAYQNNRKLVVPLCRRTGEDVYCGPFTRVYNIILLLLLIIIILYRYCLVLTNPPVYLCGICRIRKTWFVINEHRAAADRISYVAEFSSLLLLERRQGGETFSSTDESHLRRRRVRNIWFSGATR